MILLTGFGPFHQWSTNPSGTLVQALNGRVIAGHRTLGVVLPVSYARGPARAASLARWLHPTLVIGFGVASNRTASAVERTAQPDCAGLDIDGACPTHLGAATRHATLDAVALAEALGIGVSDDAGRYVCNAWLYALADAAAPAAFVHVSPAGLDPDDVAAGLERFLRAAGLAASR